MRISVLTLTLVLIFSSFLMAMGTEGAGDEAPGDETSRYETPGVDASDNMLPGGQNCPSRTDVRLPQGDVFTQNKGQAPDAVRFHSPDGGVWFGRDGVWFDIVTTYGTEYGAEMGGNLVRENGVGTAMATD